MSQTRPFRSLLAAPRRDLASLWTVLVVVLAVVSVHVLCSVHLGGQTYGAAPATSYTVGHTHDADGAVGQSRTQDVAGASVGFAASGAASSPATSGPANHGDAHGCSEHHTATAQCDPVVPQSPGAAVLPGQSVQWLVRDVADPGTPSSFGGTVAASPSLHALGISRT